MHTHAYNQNQHYVIGIDCSIKVMQYIVQINYIDALGRFDLDDAAVVCSQCSYKYGDQLSAVIHAGFWPGSISRSF